MHNRMEKIMKKRKITAIICLMLCLVLGISGLSVGIVKAVEQTEEPIELTATDQIILEGDGSETVTSEDEALQYLINNADSFGIVDGEETLEIKNTISDSDGSVYKFQQNYKGIPVFGKGISLKTDTDGTVLMSVGNYENITKDINVNPTVSKDLIIDAIQQYMVETMKFESVSDVIVSDESISAESLVVYSKGDVNATLAYELDTKFKALADEAESYQSYRLLVDANKGTVLFATGNVYTETVYPEVLSGDSIEVAYKDNDGLYHLYDEKRNIEIFDYEGRVSLSDNEKDSAVPYANTDKENWDKNAATLMNNLEKTYDYYKKLKGLEGWDGNNGYMPVYFNDMWSDGNNGYSNNEVIAGVKSTKLVLGKNWNFSDSLDLIAHEYAHSVQFGLMDMQYCGETGAIMEAYADIMGEIIENKTSWVSASKRNIEFPAGSDNPQKIGDKNYSYDLEANADNDHGNVHQNSTVLSHASYVMYTGVNKTQRLSKEQIASLWYETLKTNVNPQIKFQEFGVLMYKTAIAMSKQNILNSEQCECVAEALRAAGIKIDRIVIEVTQKTDCYINDAYNVPLDEALVDIYLMDIDENGKYYVKETKPVYETTTGTKGKFSVNDLEEDSFYEIIITDTLYQEEESKEVYIHVVKPKEGKSKLIIDTEFRKDVVKDFALSDEDIDLAVNQYKYIEPIIKPQDVPQTAYEITWSSTDEKVVTVDSDGRLKGINEGKANIKAVLKNKGKTFKSEITVNVTKKQRETVLVLDCSSSMHGRPLSEMKQSAVKFCEALMNGGGENYVEIVTFGTSASKSGFKNNLSDLTSYINNISADGSTNMYQGLSMASDELNASDRKNSIQNIVVMSDGEPCEGSTQNSGVMSNWVSAHSGYSFYYSYAEKYGNAVCSLSDSLKADYNIYSLGFFHTMSADEKAYCSYLIDYIDNKGYYEVTDADNLQISFDDISGHVSNGSKIVITVACPVDVSVSLNGETLSSSRADYNESASFGTLKKTGVANDIKVLELDSANNYDISFKGNGSGTMDYTVTYYNSDDSIEQTRNFTSVPISASTLMTSNTAKDQDTELKIDSDGDGQVDSIWTASADKDGSETFKDEKAITAEVTATAIDVEDENETEEKSSDKTVWIVLIVCSSIVILASIGAIAAVALKKVPEEKDNNKNNKDNKDKNSGDVKKACGIVVLLDGSMKGKQLSFESGKVHSIGKDATKADVLIDKSYQSISRLHCTIEFDERHNGYYITDYSSNGTYLMNSGKRLEHGKRTLIARNTVIYLAQKNCRIELK